MTLSHSFIIHRSNEVRVSLGLKGQRLWMLYFVKLD